MIRQCTEKDFDEIFVIINDAAQAYKGVIPADCWHEPYMSREKLSQEIAAAVIFWGWEEKGNLQSVMGIQDKGEVTLIRHAYVRTHLRNQGIGAKLLRHLETLTQNPILIGTWADATWAVSFYQKNGYHLVSTEEKNLLLKKYWSIPKRQVETSVVLASKNFKRI
jgi:GNAT superfamily N-acetyltransferase